MGQFPELESKFEKAQYLQDLLISKATGGSADSAHYATLRGYFLNDPNTKRLVPSLVRTNRDLSQFWPFIKHKFRTYEERRQFMWSEFNPLLQFLESSDRLPPDSAIAEGLQRFNAEAVRDEWAKALDRRATDPEGAITVARSMLESLCKHILDTLGVEYSQRADIGKLYRETSRALKLSPDQYSEDVFKKILGGCGSVINGLGALRNKLGDAHGKGRSGVRPAPRHAELAVNLAGSVALFLVQTFEVRSFEER